MHLILTYYFKVSIGISDHLVYIVSKNCRSYSSPLDETRFDLQYVETVISFYIPPCPPQYFNGCCCTISICLGVPIFLLGVSAYPISRLTVRHSSVYIVQHLCFSSKKSYPHLFVAVIIC